MYIVGSHAYYQLFVFDPRVSEVYISEGRLLYISTRSALYILGNHSLYEAKKCLGVYKHLVTVNMKRILFLPLGHCIWVYIYSWCTTSYWAIPSQIHHLASSTIVNLFACCVDTTRTCKDMVAKCMQSCMKLFVAILVCIGTMGSWYGYGIAWVNSIVWIVHYTSFQVAILLYGSYLHPIYNLSIKTRCYHQ